jgi:hypothetical protein
MAFLVIISAKAFGPGLDGASFLGPALRPVVSDFCANRDKNPMDSSAERRRFFFILYFNYYYNWACEYKWFFANRS